MKLHSASQSMARFKSFIIFILIRTNFFFGFIQRMTNEKMTHEEEEEEEEISGLHKIRGTQAVQIPI